MSDVGEQVTLRRREVGMSRGQLADAIGATVGAIQALEGGADLDNWPLRLVRRLLETLGLTWDELAGSPSNVGPVERIGAELARTGECPLSAMAPHDTDDLVADLRSVLARAGMTVAFDGAAGTVALVPRADVPPLERAGAAGSPRHGSRGLTGPEREVVTAIYNGRLDLQRLGAAHSRALATLVRVGLVELEQGQPRLAGALAAAVLLHDPESNTVMSQAAVKVPA